MAGFAHDGVIAPLDDLLSKIGADTTTSSRRRSPGRNTTATVRPAVRQTPTRSTMMSTPSRVGLDPNPPKTLDDLWAYARSSPSGTPTVHFTRAGSSHPPDPYKNLEQTSALFDCQFFDDASKKVTINSTTPASPGSAGFKEVVRHLQQEQRHGERDCRPYRW